MRRIGINGWPAYGCEASDSIRHVHAPHTTDRVGLINILRPLKNDAQCGGSADNAPK
jgi:hypothetical protein